MEQLPKSVEKGEECLAWKKEGIGRYGQLTWVFHRRTGAGCWSVLGALWPTAPQHLGYRSRSFPLLLFLSWPSGGTGSPLAHSLQVGGVYSYDCSFGHVPNVELMKFIAMATFGSYLSTCPEPEPGNLGLTVYHRAFLFYSFLRSGEALNPEYYCGKWVGEGGYRMVWPWLWEDC